MKTTQGSRKGAITVMAPVLTVLLLLAAPCSEAGTFRVENRLDVPVTVLVAGLDLPDEFRSLGFVVRNTRQIEASADWEYQEGFEEIESEKREEKERIFEFDVPQAAGKLRGRPIGNVSVIWKRGANTGDDLSWSGMQDDTPGDRVVMIKVRKDSDRNVKVIRIRYK
jgi:hypothetical protein